MLPLATNRSTAAQKGTMTHSTEYKALSGAARKAILVKLVAQVPSFTDAEVEKIKEILVIANESESEVIKDLAAKLAAKIAVPTVIEAPATQPEAEKKDTPVTTVDFAKLELAAVATAPAPTAPLTVSGKADLGRNFRDRHPECFAAKAK